MEMDYIQDIDRIRDAEYPLLSNTTYLDHAGTTLYAKSLVDQFSKDLCSNIFGNPHSASPSSTLSTERVESVRSRILRFYKADLENFDVIFTANATAAIKMVMHAFQDIPGDPTSQQQPGFWYGYHSDAHTSLVGIRRVACNGSRCFKSDDEVEHWLKGEGDTEHDKRQLRTVGLFAYPAQSNMNGHRLPLSWAGRIRSSSHPNHKNVYTLLDAAAYVSTAPLDLSDAEMAPDFISLSFYKIFGFPDLGALIVRKAAGPLLQHRRYFGGGTVDMVIAIDAEWHAKKDHELHDALEDGTLPFHNIIALDAALDTHARLYGTTARVSAHACYLSKVLYDGLRSLHHGNGKPVCEIYKHPASTYGDTKTQGPTVALNIHNSQGGWVGKSDVERLGIVRGIQMRTGGVCNPGGIATYLSLKPWEFRRNFAEGVRCGNEFDILGGKPTGIVRVSLGAMSNLTDVRNFLSFVRDLFIETTIPPVLFVESPRPRNQPVIESITIYPLRGAKGWQVPSICAWDIKEAGLAWDREWCLVSKETGLTLKTEDHPKLKQLEPRLCVEEGLLAISFPVTQIGEVEEKQTISVSLWDSPPEVPSRMDGGSFYRLADAYTSTSLEKLFTDFIGLPCTLARYPDHRLTLSPKLGLGNSEEHGLSSSQSALLQAHEQPRRASSLISDLSPEDAITISIDGRLAHGSNLAVTGMLEPSWKYIRIGPHYFISLAKSNASLRQLRHIPNLFDISLTSQNPTMRVGDGIKTYSSRDCATEAGLHACAASTLAADFICPVPCCRKEMTSRDEKMEHFLTHSTTTRSIAKAEKALLPIISIREVAVPGSELELGARKANSEDFPGAVASEIQRETQRGLHIQSQAGQSEEKKNKVADISGGASRKQSSSRFKSLFRPNLKQR